MKKDNKEIRTKMTLYTHWRVASFLPFYNERRNCWFANVKENHDSMLKTELLRIVLNKDNLETQDPD